MNFSNFFLRLILFKIRNERFTFSGLRSVVICEQGVIDHMFVDLNYVVRPWESIADRVHLVDSHEAANIFARVAIIDFEINGTERFRRDNLGTNIHFPEDASQLNNKSDENYLFKK